MKNSIIILSLASLILASTACTSSEERRKRQFMSALSHEFSGNNTETPAAHVAVAEPPAAIVEPPVEFATEKVAYSDSARIAWVGKVNVNISVDYPVLSQSKAYDPACDWVYSVLVNGGLMYEDRDVPLAIARSNGSVDLVNAVGRYCLYNAKSEIEELAIGESEFKYQYDYQWTIDTVYQDDKVVSFNASLYSYTGGAHGMTALSSAMFDLSTGQKVGWDMFSNDCMDSVLALIRRGLMTDYFQVSSPAEMSEYIFGAYDEIPLPSETPFFTSEGVVFRYGSYEIAPYVYGFPECELSYQVLEPYFSPLGRSLAGFTHDDMVHRGE